MISLRSDAVLLGWPRTALAALAGLAMLATACAQSAPPAHRPARPVPRAEPTPPARVASAPTREASAPARRTAAIPSLARADWPCAHEIDFEGSIARCSYTYDDARTSCLHQPDSWEPGCPARIECVRGPDRRYEYDARGLVTRFRENGSGWATTWSDDATRFEGGAFMVYEGVGAVIESTDAATGGRGRIEFDASGRPVLWRAWRPDGALWSEERWTYAGPRLVERRSSPAPRDVRVRYLYDCR